MGTIGRIAASGVLIMFSALCGSVVFAQDARPNILVIWGDDIGWSNLSAYEGGVMA